MVAPRNETQLVGRIVRAIAAEFPAAWVVKVHGGQYQTVGIPDLLVALEGRLVALEVKHQKNGESVDRARRRVTPTQQATLEAIRRAGGVATVVITVEEALNALRWARSHHGITWYGNVLPNPSEADPRISPHPNKKEQI